MTILCQDDSILSYEDWTAEGEALTDVFLAIFRINGDLLLEGDRLAGEFGQSSARWQVLGAIDAEALTVPGIARVMGLTRQSVQRTVDLLEVDGLVQYRDNPAHRRSKLVAMSARGRKVYESISAKQTEWVNRLSAEVAVGAKELRKTLNVLESLGMALEQTIESNEGA